MGGGPRQWEAGPGSGKCTTLEPHRRVKLVSMWQPSSHISKCPGAMLGPPGAAQGVSGSQGAKAFSLVFVSALVGLVACQSHGLFTSGIIQAR